MRIVCLNIMKVHTSLNIWRMQVKASLQWANGIGLINGKTESTLNPLDNATRAEAATIFYRFVKAN